jgi:hypothetical protein
MPKSFSEIAQSVNASRGVKDKDLKKFVKGTTRAMFLRSLMTDDEEEQKRKS